MKSLRVVMDTNIVLSALVFANARMRILRNRWMSDQIIPLISQATTQELIRVLAYPKFGLTELDQRELLENYLPFCETVVLPKQQPEIPHCKDRFDQMFLELAVAAQADVLVTGDKDLLDMESVFIFPIIDLSEFFESFLNETETPT